MLPSDENMNIFRKIMYLTLGLCISGVLSDHHHGYDAAYVYPDQSYSYQNNSIDIHHGTQRSRYIDNNFFN